MVVQYKKYVFTRVIKLYGLMENATDIHLVLQVPKSVLY